MKPYMTPVAICGLAVLFSTHGRAQEQAEQDPSQIGRERPAILCEFGSSQMQTTRCAPP
jgi:hypothetical protein